MKKLFAILLLLTLLLSIYSCAKADKTPDAQSSDTKQQESSEVIPTGPVEIPISRRIAPSDAPVYYGDMLTENIPSDECMLYLPDGISVTARLIETLPDTYTFYNDWEQSPFRLLKMKTVHSLKGNGMPEEFYFWVPADYMTDFSLYHTFVFINMLQYAFDYAVLYNVTKDCVEQINLAMFGSFDEYYLGESVMAFNEDGILNKALWRANDRWIEEAEYSYRKYPETYTLQDAESTFKYNAKNNNVHLLEGVTGEAAEAAAFIKNAENGFHVHTRSDGSIFYLTDLYFDSIRYINGFSTNETVRITSEKWQGEQIDKAKFSKARFTEEDLQRLPDLRSAYAAVCDAYETGQIAPPHIQTIAADAYISEGIFGWYAKTADGVLGIIRVTWRIYQNKDDYYDDLYYIIEYGSDVCKLIERDALLDKIGEYGTHNIYTGEYNENGKIPPAFY